MKLRFTRRAVRHLDEIASYIAKDSPAAARRVGSRIRETADLLVSFPELGHDGVLPRTREIVVPGLPYIIVYRVEPTDPDLLTILAVYHGAQMRPGQTPPDM